jgi:chorismate mutase
LKLPDPILPSLEFPSILKPNDININDKIKDCYINQILPMITVDRDDGNYGSAATKDIEALQLISRRIHFGKFVAEAKYNDPKLHDIYVALVKAKDRNGILELLTVSKVEEALLVRVQQKALIYGQEVIVNNQGVLFVDSNSLKIPLEVIKKLYKDIIIPLTKEVEVEYLLQRGQE